AFAVLDSSPDDGISLAGGGYEFLNSHVSVDALQKLRDNRGQRAEMSGMQLPGQIMLESALHDFEPVLDDHVRAGFVAPTGRYIDPRLFVDVLHDKLVELGVESLEHTELVGIVNSTATLRSAAVVTQRVLDMALF